MTRPRDWDKPHYRLRHMPVRTLTDAELDDAYNRGWVSPALLKAERWRRHVEERTRASIAGRRSA